MEWIFIIIGLAIGLIIALIVLSKNTTLQKEIQQLTGDKRMYQAQAEQLLSSNNTLDSELKSTRSDFNNTEKTLIQSQQENSYLRELVIDSKGRN